MPTVLFLCTGNYYRSRFAEYVFNHHATPLDSPWRASSRALRVSPRNVGPLSVHAIEALGQLQIPLEDPLRMPIAATRDDFEQADMIIALKEAEHRAMIEAGFAAWQSRVEYWQIHDLDCATPEEALPVLQEQVGKLLKRLTR